MIMTPYGTKLYLHLGSPDWVFFLCQNDPVLTPLHHHTSYIHNERLKRNSKGNHHTSSVLSLLHQLGDPPNIGSPAWLFEDSLAQFKGVLLTEPLKHAGPQIPARLNPLHGGLLAMAILPLVKVPKPRASRCLGWCSGHTEAAGAEDGSYCGPIVRGPRRREGLHLTQLELSKGGNQIGDRAQPERAAEGLCHRRQWRRV